MPPEWTQTAAGIIMMTPTYAKGPIAARNLDNGDLAPKLTRPLLLMAGTRDPAAPPAKLAEIVAKVPGARRIDYPDVGHMPFLESADAFVRDLDAFATAARGTP
jgi:pimeloyl-ACP methyl ester carboxylesterase